MKCTFCSHAAQARIQVEYDLAPACLRCLEEIKKVGEVPSWEEAIARIDVLLGRDPVASWNDEPAAGNRQEEM